MVEKYPICPENTKNKAENDSFSALFGADVHKGFNNNAGTYNLFSFKRTFSKSPLLRYNVLAKEDFAL